jgi:hypothetical protein
MSAGGRVGDDAGDGGWVDLPDAIEGLRAALEAAWRDGLGRQVRFRLEPVELTVQAGVTRAGKGSAGVRWHVLALGGERSRQDMTTQTLKLRLAPVLYGADGTVLADGDQLVSDRDDPAAAGEPGVLAGDPE